MLLGLSPVLLAADASQVGLLTLAAVSAALAAGLVYVLRARGRDAAGVSRVNRALRAVSACDKALVHADDETSLLDEICRVIVDTGGYHLAWVGYAIRDEARSVNPVAQAGVERAFLEDLHISWADSERGQSPAGTAIRTGRPVIAQDVANDRSYDPWREAAQRVGFASSLALPLITHGEALGALVIYASEADAFDEAEVALLGGLADDLAFGLEALRVKAEHDRAVKALAESEDQHSLVLNNVWDVVFAVSVDPGGEFRFASVNRRFLETTGLPEDQIVGARVRDIVPEAAHDLVFGKYREAIESGRPARWEEVSDYPAGKRIGTVTVVPVFDDQGSCTQLVGLVHDITERQEAERALEESERKYRELVESVSSIILRWTQDGRVTFLNAYGQKFFGYQAKDIVGRHVVGTIVPMTDSLGRDLGDLMERILTDPVAFEQTVNENMLSSGERVWIAWTNRLVTDPSGAVEVLSVGTDVTRLKRAEKEIAALNASLERRVARRTAELAVAKERAESADRVKSAFLATMSHELRTPLNSIIGFTGIMLQELAGPLNEEQHKQLEMVRGSSRHLLALINDVLDISKIEAGQLEVSREPFDVRASVDKVVGLVRPLAETKGLALRVELGRDLGEVASDSRRVEQVLLNLLNNAVKFTDSGCVTLSVDHVAAAGSTPAALDFCVADTGIGIKPKDLTELFQPFRQVDAGLARQHEGTGLGLAICRRLADLLGGTVDATSEWGKGSVFTFTLPTDGVGDR